MLNQFKQLLETIEEETMDDGHISELGKVYIEKAKSYAQACKDFDNEMPGLARQNKVWIEVRQVIELARQEGF